MAEKREIEEIYSKSVRAGRRTYFFDVRSTRAGDYYMTLTESKRDFNEDGTPFYKKHKIYLYKEDFTNFQEALKDVSEFIIKEKGEEIISDKKFVKPIEKRHYAIIISVLCTSGMGLLSLANSTVLSRRRTTKR